MNCPFCGMKLSNDHCCFSCAKLNNLELVWVGGYVGKWVEIETERNVFICERDENAYVVDMRDKNNRMAFRNLGYLKLTPQNAREHCERILKLTAFS